MSISYGRLTFQNDRWVMSDVPPHVAIRLKSIFPRVPKHQTKVFDLPNTTSMCADLDWFLSRYPMEMAEQDRVRLALGGEEFERDRQATEQILTPDWTPPEKHGFRPPHDAHLHQKQASELWLRKKGLLIGDPTGLGKEQPLTAKLLTPTGWARMANAYIGMQIVGRDGGTYEITGVFPQGKKPAYRLTFTDDSSAECGLDHLWMVRDQNRKKRGRGWTVKTLAELIDGGIRYKDGVAKWEIPLADAARFESKHNLPIPAYVMGVLLGDGYTKGGNTVFSAPEKKREVLDRVVSLLGENRVTGPHGTVGSEQYHILGLEKSKNGFTRYLRDAGLSVGSREKFIPEEYLFSGADDRVELLRGLMDTDGSANSNRICFHSCSERLAADVAHLVRSLGGTSSVRRYDRTSEGKPVEFQVNVRLHINPFHLTYKACQWRNCESTGRARRFLHKVESIGAVEQQCISVSSPDRLYVTDDFVVTHNTHAALYALAGSHFLPAAIVVQAHLPTQWVNEYIAPFTYMSAHIIDGTKPYSLPPANLYVFRYSNIAGWSDIAGTGFFKSVVYDEIQELRGGTDTRKGAAAKVFSDNAELRLGLSATPVFNYGSEIFNIYRFIDEEVLGHWNDFVREWCRMGPGGKWVVSDPDALGSYLREQQVFIRREKQGRKINRLPIQVDFDEEIAESAEQLARVLAQKVVNGTFIEAGSAARELDAFARLQTGLAKAKSVAALAKLYLRNGQPLVLCGWHRSVYDIWLEELKEFKPILYTGSETAKQKDKAKEAFINGDSHVIILSLRSGAGLDGLQRRCSTVIIGELDWSPAIYTQVEGRLDRPGQPEEEVTVVFPYVEYGSDPTIMRVNAIKSDQARGINDPGLAPPPVYTDESRIRMLAKSFLGDEEQ